MKEYETETHIVRTMISPDYRIEPCIPVTIIGHYEDDVDFGGADFCIDRMFYADGREEYEIFKTLGYDEHEALHNRITQERKVLLEGKTEFEPDDKYYEDYFNLQCSKREM